MVNSVPPDHNPTLAGIRDRALGSTDVSFVLTDALQPGWPIVWVNEAFTRTTGYALSEVLGRGPDLLQGPATDPAVVARMGRAIAQGEPITATVLNYRADGETFWNQVSISPVRDESGRVTHHVGIQVDVTGHMDHADAQQRSIDVERRARSGLTLLAHVSDLLLDLDDPYLLREIASLLRQEMVAWAGFFVDDDAGLHPAVTLQTEHHRSRGDRPPQDVGDVGDPRRSPPDPVRELLDGVADGPLDLSLTDPPVGPTTTWLVEHLRSRFVDAPEISRVVVTVVPGRRRPFGLLVVAPHGGGACADLAEDDRAVLSLVVRRVGMAVDNLRLYAREHLLAETLQRAMLPEQAEVDDLDVWSYYAPSAGHAQVGGDWFDVLQISTDVVGLVIGDVVGHDVEAAAAMGQLRSVVRSYAFEVTVPGPVLERVDTLITGMRIPRAASLVFATLSREDTGWLLEYSRAGHLPPLVIRDGEVVQLSGAMGPMLGFGHEARSTAAHHLEPGDVLLLYTDGLIERRDRSLRDGLTALVDVSGRLGVQEAAGLGEELLSRLANAPEDDVALVVVRVPDPDAAQTPGVHAPRRRRWSLPSDPASIARARHAVVRTCAAWEIEGAASAELVVSEMVANAVLHGWGHVVLRLFDTGEGLRIEVEDANPAPPVTTDGHPGRIGGYGMQIVERLGDWGWRPAGAGKLVWARVRPLPISAALAGGRSPSRS
ncbi:SpoIIE family protein phosphatase [Actinotalea sp. K2]|uniref:SpoIIE family protein phosphatase n=1 Tax=Actinotalea sp. K2 TaxID=2939438 RepID=UPI002016AA90|nr:SpoIIE family protein phosphatase [Actinotalea sp. K2]MCL3863167.1 SpoIIE family protein phosphatase [Actinotalea sp. K2]